MKYRKLRIAWSVGCGFLCLLLIALWVRSYWRFDVAIVRLGDSTLTVTVCQGKTSLAIASVDRSMGAESLYIAPGNWYTTTESWKLLHVRPDSGLGRRLEGGSYYGSRISNRPRFYDSRGSAWRLESPIWLLVFVSAAVAVALVFAKQWRFSLRTLLIVITLAAVVLGLIVFLNRAPTSPPFDVGDFTTGED